MPYSKAEMDAIIADYNDTKNLFTEKIGVSEKHIFISGIFEAINNRDIDRFPYAQLNSNGSVSLFFHKCNSDKCAECGKTDAFDAALELYAPQIEHHRERIGLPLAEGATAILSTIDHVEDTELMEYRFNLSPLHLDNILKYNSTYGGYRNTKSGGLLALVTNHAAQFSEEAICLFPVKILDDKHCTPLIAGCQTTEIPSLQLRQFIPGYDGVDRPFHWIPPEVGDYFGVAHFTIEAALNKLLEQSKMQIGGQRMYAQSDDHLFYCPDPKDAPIKLNPMSDGAREIYLKYGNTGALELEHCLSAEVKTIDFLNAIRSLIHKEDDPDAVAHIEEIIERLVKKEASMQRSGGASASMAVEEESEPPRPRGP